MSLSMIMISISITYNSYQDEL